MIEQSKQTWQKQQPKAAHPNRVLTAFVQLVHRPDDDRSSDADLRQQLQQAFQQVCPPRSVKEQLMWVAASQLIK
jgi:hypothetical protein